MGVEVVNFLNGLTDIELSEFYKTLRDDINKTIAFFDMSAFKFHINSDEYKMSDTISKFYKTTNNETRYDIIEFTLSYCELALNI